MPSGRQKSTASAKGVSGFVADDRQSVGPVSHGSPPVVKLIRRCDDAGHIAHLLRQRLAHAQMVEIGREHADGRQASAQVASDVGDRR